MLYMKQPSFVLNSCDVPPPLYSMWDTFDAPKWLDTGDLVQRILRSASRALRWKGRPLVNVILNCHGGPGEVCIGGIDSPCLGWGHQDAFTVLKPLNLGGIWIVSCDAAAGGGNLFCSALAKAAGCSVIASSGLQEVSIVEAIPLFMGGPFFKGCIDEYEGQVWRFPPLGGEIPIEPRVDHWTTTLLD